MGKFVKSKIDALKEKKKALSNSFKIKAMFKGKQGLYTFYSIWFAAIKAYISGSPSTVMKQAWKIYVIPFIPRDWVCDDSGYEGVKAKRRCKLINHRLKKQGEISKKDIVWLENELLPAFEKDFELKNLSFDKLGVVNEDAIAEKLKQTKKEKKFKEMLK